MNRIYLIQFKAADDSILIDRIKSLGPWMNYFGHSWIVQTTLSAQEIYNKLSVNYEKESIFVIELDPKNYWGRMDTTVWDWLKTKK
jgi:hypothetical protein